MSTGDDDQAGPINTLAQQVNTNKQNIQTNAELIQTKTSGPDPSINNSVARFVGTDGTTITSSDIVVDDNANIGVGTVTPNQKLDVRTPGSQASQVHISSMDNDADFIKQKIIDYVFGVVTGYEVGQASSLAITQAKDDMSDLSIT